jgi:hypothetical protein
MQSMEAAARKQQRLVLGSEQSPKKMLLAASQATIYIHSGVRAQLKPAHARDGQSVTSLVTWLKRKSRGIDTDDLHSRTSQDAEVQVPEGCSTYSVTVTALAE